MRLASLSSKTYKKNIIFTKNIYENSSGEKAREKTEIYMISMKVMVPRDVSRGNSSNNWPNES